MLKTKELKTLNFSPKTSCLHMASGHSHSNADRSYLGRHTDILTLIT